MSTPLTPTTVVYGFSSATDPQISPDGARIVYGLSKADPETKKSGSQLWITDRDGGHKRQLTQQGQKNAVARWSPDANSNVTHQHTEARRMLARARRR